jgi:hypothetical protein
MSYSWLLELWPVKIALLIVLLWFFRMVFPFDIGRIMHELLREFKELLTAKWTSRSINALTIVCVFTFGIIAVLLMKAPEFVALVSRLGSDGVVVELKESVQPIIIIVVLGIVAILSIWVTIKADRS